MATHGLPLSGRELMKLALLVYELVEEAGFVVVADVLDVPQAWLADLGAGGVMAEPSALGWSSPSARGDVRAMLLPSTQPRSAPLLDGKPQKRHRPDVAAGGLLDPRLLLRPPRSGPVAVEPGNQATRGAGSRAG